MTQIARIQKLITFSSDLFNLGEKKAKRLGLPFTEYIRYLLVSDVKDEAEPIEMLDEETSKRVEQGLKDHKEGRYTLAGTPEEIQAHLDKLSNGL